MYASQPARNSGLNLSPNPSMLFLPDGIGDSKIGTNLRNN
jgi:hypothetical protein